MNLELAKSKLADTEEALNESGIAEYTSFETPFGGVAVIVTECLRKKCRKGKVWKSKAILAALQTAALGLDPKSIYKGKTSKGIFVIKNDPDSKTTVMRKIFDRFLDKPDPFVPDLEKYLGSDRTEWVPVILASDSFKLIGVIDPGSVKSRLILVDYEKAKPAKQGRNKENETVTERRKEGTQNSRVHRKNRA